MENDPDAKEMLYCSRMNSKQISKLALYKTNYMDALTVTTMPGPSSVTVNSFHNLSKSR